MDRGLLAPLSPHEEIALRRVANGSVDVATRHADRLIKLALVKRGGKGLRLTAIGLRRLRTLPGSEADKAPLDVKIARKERYQVET